MSAILPGAAIGVLGSGQLGRMMAIAARRMGYRVHTLSPDSDSPTGQVADREVVAAYDDLDAVEEFARRVDVVTFEFENVSFAAAQAAARHAPVRPAGSVLHTTQNRLREKTFLASNGFPCPAFAAIAAPGDLASAVERVGFPAVLKTAGFGYDGKGQSLVRSAEELKAAWDGLERQPAILERFVEFEAELSVIGARGSDGSFAWYGPVRNRHERHILDLTVAPGGFPPEVERRAVEIARGVLEALGVVGVLCVEMFLDGVGRLLVNELAPRPHNSGHYSFDACVTSQFEQQVRAVCGLPLGSTEQLRPAAMANLLGDLWSAGEPRWEAALAYPGVKLHLYGKAEARPGRKMGHLTALADSPEEAARTVLRARDALIARD
ncbi:MAG: 5-(carboxyamino)imidazole ribonucleotide synthase [Fimbriimonadales bacterium]|nr:5-(carboxyamino)imidazole ribonucleotide synthase [Fimbriimonadales bacterium]